jgi:outer membrane biosynthesis protein TonB
VRLKIGDAVPADSVAVSDSKTPKTTGGHPAQQVDPVYPADALPSGIEGDVEAVLVVNKAGIAEQVLISNGDPLLASAVVSALEHWRYSAF